MWFYCVLFLCFFFFKQKTAYEVRISDWSSDVCSSDLCHSGRACLLAEFPDKSSLTRSARVPPVIDVPESDEAIEQRAEGQHLAAMHVVAVARGLERSEERRVGKEGVGPFRSRWSP